jgi:hypothetical protein
MKNKTVICPKCLTEGVIMQPKSNGKKGFEYKSCNLCNSLGTVIEEIEEDYLLSINEDLINEYD